MLKIDKDKIILERENEKYESTSKTNTKENIENVISIDTDKWTNQLLRDCIEYISIDTDKNIEIKFK